MSAEAGSDSSVITTICAVGGLLIGFISSGLGVYNFAKARNKEKREEKLRASLNLVKAEYKQGSTRHGQLATFLYVTNSDIRPVSDIRVEFFGQDDEMVRQPEGIPSLVFGGVHCVGFFTSGQKMPTRAKLVYTDYDGRPHDYRQEAIHSNPHNYAVRT